LGKSRRHDTGHGDDGNGKKNVHGRWKVVGFVRSDYERSGKNNGGVESRDAHGS
jgi:hypothetical protein